MNETTKVYLRTFSQDQAIQKMVDKTKREYYKKVLRYL